MELVRSRDCKGQLGQKGCGRPTYIRFVLIFFFYLSFSSYLNSQFKFQFKFKLCDSSCTYYICAIKSNKFEDIYLNILFIFYIPSLFLIFKP
jgi:hypothetical protein